MTNISKVPAKPKSFIKSKCCRDNGNKTQTKVVRAHEELNVLMRFTVTIVFNVYVYSIQWWSMICSIIMVAL